MDSHIITLLLWYSAWLGHAFGHYTTHPNHYQSHHHHHNQPDWLPTDQNTRNYPATGPNGFVEFYRWTQMTYAALDSNTTSAFASANSWGDLSPAEIQRDFVQYNNLPMGVMHHGDRLFITLPRRRTGMPATIAYVRTNFPRSSSPALQAYPNFRTNQLPSGRQPNANRIISVYRSRVDECNRLWFVDTGQLEYPNNPIQVQPPSIWIMNLDTDQVIRRFEIPTSIITDGHGIASITPDVERGKCDDAYAYLPDLANYRLHVYSFRQNRLWSFQHNYFNFDPIRGDFDVAGVNFQWNDGIFSVTLGNREWDDYRRAFFHAMASVSEFAVSTKILQNETMSTRSNHGKDFKFLGHRSDLGQSAMHAYDNRTGVIFFSQVATNAIACWNTAKPLKASNIGIIARDDTYMIYPADINIDADGIIWVLTNGLPVYNYARLNPNDYNYRIWTRSAADAIRNTVCDVELNTRLILN